MVRGLVLAPFGEIPLLVVGERREMTDDFRTRRVRLEHALNVGDNVSAQKEVRILLQFTENKSGEYVTWLSNLDRTLKLKAGSKKR